MIHPFDLVLLSVSRDVQCSIYTVYIYKEMIHLVLSQTSA